MAIVIDATLTGVLVVIIGTGPQVSRVSFAVVPPRLRNTVDLERSVFETIILLDTTVFK